MEARQSRLNLHDFNVSRIGAGAIQSFSLVAIESGDLVGGILAQTAVEWLQVDLLWVAADPGAFRVGRALFAEAEAKAQRRGCRCALLDTFDWQAEPLYRKQGYEVLASSGAVHPRDT